MSNGEQEIVINPSERAISDDQNRAQRFRGLDLNELLRALADTYCGLDDVQASALDQQTTTSTSPASSAVFNGLVVRPQLGSLNLLIDPGVVALYDPDSPANPDESQYKLIRDPGVTLVGTLQLPSNTSGGTIVSVIECARVGGGFSVLETDSRDIFNPVTGLFTASTVNKVIAGRLQYRVRSGGSGGGFPGTAAGWVPLCVVSQPTGTTSITSSNMTFWDVRPFVGDRILPPFNLAALVPRNRSNVLEIDTITTPGKALVGGYVEASATDAGSLSGAPAGLYRLGGFLPGSLDLNVAGNQSGSLTTGVGYVYLLEPFGLPRWAQYVFQSGVLQPGNPRGIVTASMTQPLPLLLAPSSPLALPTATGLGGSTSKAVCIGATNTGTGNIFGLVTDGSRQYAQGTAIFGTKSLTLAGAICTTSYLPGTDYPSNAKSIAIRIVAEISVTGNSNDSIGFRVGIQDATNTHYLATVAVLETESVANAAGSTQNIIKSLTVWVPIPVAQGGFGLLVDTNTLGSNLVACTAVVDAWSV